MGYGARRSAHTVQPDNGSALDPEPGGLRDTFFGRAPPRLKSIAITPDDESAKRRREAEVEEDLSPWIILLGGRTIASGVGMLSCAALGLDRALGVGLCASIVAAGVDGWVVVRYGPRLLLGGDNSEAASADERRQAEEVTFRTGLGH
ncbi:hypothetical protein F5Y14DRAFT_455116 [Nemania sp. NC0429]|nr:hypothetical protein F5Y14DRAFT_455116 [Nemania sp. NC0429]